MHIDQYSKSKIPSYCLIAMQGYLTEMTNRKNFLLILLDKEMGQAYIPDEITLELIAEI